MLGVCTEQKLSGGRRVGDLLGRYLEASHAGRSGVRGVYGFCHHNKSYKP